MNKKRPVVLMKHTISGENPVTVNWDIRVHTGRIPKGYVQDEGLNTTEGYFRVYIWKEGFPLMAGAALLGWFEHGGGQLLLHTLDPETYHSPQCSHPGCDEIDTMYCDDGRDGLCYCEVHAVEHGYCTGCGRLVEPHESFIDGLCVNCMDEIYQYEEDDIYGAARNQERQVVLFGESDSDGT